MTCLSDSKYLSSLLALPVFSLIFYVFYLFYFFSSSAVWYQTLWTVSDPQRGSTPSVVSYLCINLYKGQTFFSTQNANITLRTATVSFFWDWTCFFFLNCCTANKCIHQSITKVDLMFVSHNNYFLERMRKGLHECRMSQFFPSSGVLSKHFQKFISLCFLLICYT